MFCYRYNSNKVFIPSVEIQCSILREKREGRWLSARLCPLDPGQMLTVIS